MPDLQNARLPDGGPLYAETNLDQLVKEPFNMVTAFFFVVLAAYWLVQLWPLRRQLPLQLACMGVLLVGGLGGTIFHGFRLHYVFLAMDFMPIIVLSLLFAYHMWWRVLGSWQWALVPVPVFFALGGTLRLLAWSQQAAISLGYINMGLSILLPLFLFLRQQRFRHLRLVLGALLAFAGAVGSRMLDFLAPQLLPMGSHFLWHSFGALACACLIAYWVHSERELQAQLQAATAGGPQ